MNACHIRTESVCVCRMQVPDSWLLPWLQWYLVTSLVLSLAPMTMRVYILLLCSEMCLVFNCSKRLSWNSSVLFLLGIAIFCMLLTYYMWIKAVKTGSVYWSSICALAYFYMVSQSEELHILWTWLRFYRCLIQCICVSRFPPGVATCSWSTLSPFMSWFWCLRGDSLTVSTWLTALSTAWAPSCPCRSLLSVSR